MSTIGSNPTLAITPTNARPTITITNTSGPSETATLTVTAIPAYKTPTLTETTPPSQTPTLTLAPTYVKLRGEVIVVQANCRYGPGEPYLYKYGLLGGSNLEIIGRNETGTWIEIQAIGGRNPCWVKADLMKIKGDVMTVQPIPPETVRLPSSPYYGPLTGVSARRNGNIVTVSWGPLKLRAGDDSEQYPYLVEAWVCRDGQIGFTPVGSYETRVDIEDDPGCSMPSHGRVYGVEKHGYTKWIEPAWPQPEG
ncbi:MAG TPA: hypothetical protein VMT46_02270 [Anaerolineaceae bacterium]|nr:hypothetical protein [Anaerolineaceae bacterium]